MKIGYKGLDKDLKSRGLGGAEKLHFNIGSFYAKDTSILSPKVCTNQGFHYCNTLKEVFNHYDAADDRYVEIEVLGNFSDDRDKSTTTAFRIIREVTKEANMLKADEKYGLELVRAMQTKYPTLQLGGSLALLMQGIDLKRNVSTDLDFINPFYINFEEFEETVNLDINEIFFQEEKSLPSGCDFEKQITLSYNGKVYKIDFLIDPKQKYRNVEFNGWKYKVSAISAILAAKMRYAEQGKEKHIEDIKNIINNKQNISKYF